MKKVILYCRVSSLRQSLYNYSLKEQEFRMRKYCESKGWEVIEVVLEIKPAKTFKERKNISRLFREMKSKNCRFDAILCLSFDRFSRDVSSAQEAMEYLIDFKVELYTIERFYNLHTVAGRREYIADAYRAMDDNLSRAAKAESSVKRRMQLGDAPFRVPLGYKKISGNRHKDPLKRTEAVVVFDEEWAQVIKEGFSLVFSGNFSADAARKNLNKKYKRKIKKQRFLDVLHNPFYMGKIKTKNEQGVYVLYEGKHPALVSESVFITVNEKINERKRNVLEYKPRNPEFPLRGFLICPSCGNKLTGGKSKSRTGVYHYYYNCQRKKSKCTFNLKIADAHLFLSNKMKRLVFTDNVKKAYMEILQSVFELDDSERNNRIAKIEYTINENLMNRLTFLDLLAAKKIMQKDFDMKIEQIEKANTELEVELNQLKAIESSYSKYIKENKPLSSDLNTFFWTNDIDCQHELLDTIIDGDMVINKDEIRQLNFTSNFMLLFKPNKEN